MDWRQSIHTLARYNIEIWDLYRKTMDAYKQFRNNLFGGHLWLIIINKSVKLYVCVCIKYKTNILMEIITSRSNKLIPQTTTMTINYIHSQLFLINFKISNMAQYSFIVIFCQIHYIYNTDWSTQLIWPNKPVDFFLYSSEKNF